MDAKNDLHLRSSIPGRERWRVASVYRNASAADHLAESLRADARVQSVVVDTGTAGVLIHFDPSSGLAVEALLRSALCLFAAHAQPPSEPERAKPERPRQPLATEPGHPRPLARLVDRVGVDPRDTRRITIGPAIASAGAFVPSVAFAAMTATAQSGGSRFLSSIGLRGIKGQLFTLGTAVLASFGLDILLSYTSKKQAHQIAAEIETRIKIQTFDRVQRLDMSYIDEQSTGRLLSVVVEDAAAVREYYENGYTDIVRKITTGIMLNGLMFIVAPTLGLVANLSIPLLVVAVRYFKPRTAAAYRDAGMAQGEFSKTLNDNLAGLATIKSFTNEELEVERLRELGARLDRATERALDARWAHAGIMRELFYASWAATVVQASYLLVSKKISSGIYSVVLFAAPELIAATFGIDETINSYRKANAAAERILEILDVENEVVDGSVALTEPCRGELRFEHVDFAYAGGSPVLDQLDLEIGPGITAIVGASGSGKSTIAKLLLRFYDVGGGRVTLDGRDIRELTLRSLRSHISYVGQDPFLFPGTIEDNLRFGRPSASMEEIREAATIAELAEFIESLPDGYQTHISERGARLSGGQRQRLCIARALLEDTPILVFDEPTSAVDNLTELALQRSIRQFQLTKDRTIILIAHRLQSVRLADHITVLEHGRIQERGTHDELLAHDGLYASLWQIQAKSPH